jgi:ATP-dependent DNA helicase RecQ
MDPKSVLRERFGFEQFRDGQEAVMRSLLDGRSALGVFPTGAGKSLCYQLPSLLLPGLTLVVSPLLALMKDQIEGLRAKGIDAHRLDSSLDEAAYRAVVEKLRAGALKLLFIAPERLGNERFLSLIRGQRIGLLAVDEAHCISAWGHNFRPEYLKLPHAARALRVERVLALTATATSQVVRDISEAFGIAGSDVIHTGFHRPNLELRVTACKSAERPELLLQRMRDRPPGATIVYVCLQRHAEEVATALQAAGIQAAPYHAGMPMESREATQEAFMRGDIPVICATIAFGMGVDKADIRFIYHYHLPKGYESYWQEIGRAGRDGHRAICELFACPDDCTTLENFVYGDTPDPGSIESVVRELLEGEEFIELAVSDLSRRHDMRQLVVKTLLTRLELLGVLRLEGHFYGSIRFAPKGSSNEILAAYDEAQAAFLRTLFTSCAKAKKWVTLDMDEAMRKTGHEREVILRALESLQHKGLAELQLAGYRQRFRRLQSHPDIPTLCKQLGDTFEEHETREIERIASMLDYARHATCLTGKLLDYFGEEVASCGHCGPCLGDPPAQLTARRMSTVEVGRMRDLAKLIEDYPEALGRPRQQARFLCGLKSPAVSATRGLRGHPLFGACEDVAFARVLNYCTGASPDGSREDVPVVH